MKKKGKKERRFWLVKSLLFLCLIILAYVGYSVFKIVYRKNQVQKEISSLEEQAAQIDKENNNLQDKIAYFESKDFQEKEVKDKLSLQNPDENLVIVKPEPAKEKQEDPINTLQENKTADNNPNYKKWWNYFFKY